MVGSVPRLFPDQTIVILASGPSLTADDIASTRHLPTIAVNDTWRVAPHAAIIFGADAKWWNWHADDADLLAHPARKFTLSWGAPDWVTQLGQTGQSGLERNPRCLRTGGHSGYAAINVAVHAGARRIILLGYDLGPSPANQHHFFGDHRDRTHPRYDQWRSIYRTLIYPLDVSGISVVNCSRVTTITAFPRVALADALALLATPSRMS